MDSPYLILAIIAVLIVVAVMSRGVRRVLGVVIGTAIAFAALVWFYRTNSGDPAQMMNTASDWGMSLATTAEGIISKVLDSLGSLLNGNG